MELYLLVLKKGVKRKTDSYFQGITKFLWNRKAQLCITMHVWVGTAGRTQPQLGKDQDELPHFLPVISI